MRNRFDADTIFATLVLLSLLDKLDRQESIIVKQDAAIAKRDALLSEMSELLAEDLDVIHAQANRIEELESALLRLAALDRRQSDALYLGQQDMIDQIVRAIDDLGLSHVVGRRMVANFGLDIMGMGAEVTSAPTLRNGDPSLLDGLDVPPRSGYPAALRETTIPHVDFSRGGCDENGCGG